MPTFVHCARTAKALSFTSSGLERSRLPPVLEQLDEHALVAVAQLLHRVAPLAGEAAQLGVPERRLSRAQRVRDDVIDDEARELQLGRGLLGEQPPRRRP